MTWREDDNRRLLLQFIFWLKTQGIEVDVSLVERFVTDACEDTDSKESSQ